MTKSFRSQSGLLALLALFVVGGVLGPPVHRIQHEKELREKRTEATCEHDAHEAPVFEHRVPDLQDEAPCPFCMRNHFAAEILQPSIVRPYTAVSRIQAPRDARLAALPQHHFIRGPPANA